jgi:putative NADH-flavin reductase
MRILVIGSTGQTGKHVVQQGLKRGHAITAFSRRPQLLDNIQGLSSIIHGDGHNLADIRKAVQSQEAVIVSGGDSEVARNVIIAMHEAGVRRLVMTSSRSIVATQPQWLIALVWIIFRPFYADLARAEGMIEMSGLDWSVVRGTMLNNKPGKGQVHIDFEPNQTGGDWQLPREDYAMTLLDVAENPNLIGKALGVNGAKTSKPAQVKVEA